MESQHRILLLDDDPDVLSVYQELLAKLPSRPVVETAGSGTRALALLDAKPFSLLLSDLNMPKMDGLQVLTIVRRRFPKLRTAVLTSIKDDQFRARAYGMGIDLYLEKPCNSREISFFLDCVESLLGREDADGFRGVQSKSLLDLIQLECLSQGSSALRIVNGSREGTIWFKNGEIVDAEAAEVSGAEAFQRILGWKTGSFEILPSDPDRTRTIFTSHQGLLLQFAQAHDEAQGEPQDSDSGSASASPSASDAEASAPSPAASAGAPKATECAQISGVEIALGVAREGDRLDCWGADDPEALKTWTHDTLERFHQLGEALQTGALKQIEASTHERHLMLARTESHDLCIGFHRALKKQDVRDRFHRAIEVWDS